MAFDFVKNLTNIGNSFMQMGIGYGISKEAMRGGGYGGGCGGGSIWGGGMAYSGGYGMGGYGMGMGYGGGMGMGYNNYMDYGPDPRLLAMGNQQAYEFGTMAATQSLARLKDQYRTPDAEAVADDTDKKNGAKLEKAIDANSPLVMVYGDWKTLNTKENRTEKEQQKLEEEYREKISIVAKSFVAQLQAEGDGQITAEKYVEYFKAHQQTDNMKEDQIAKIEQAAYNEFANLDLNDSGAIDYKEISAYINVMDKDKKGKVDGELASDDIKSVGEESVKADNSSFRGKLKESYQKLFGGNQQSGYMNPFGLRY